MVERLVANVCRRHHRAIPDLVQMVYEALLKYDGQKLMRIHDRGALNFFIVRVIGNLYFSRTNPLLSTDSEILPNERRVER